MSKNLTQDFGDSESEGEDFNPQAEVASDNGRNRDDDLPDTQEMDDDDDDDEDAPPRRPVKSGKASRSRSRSRRRSPDEDEDEGDEEEAGESSARRVAREERKARAAAEQDEDAEGGGEDLDDDDDDDDDEDEEDAVQGHRRKRQRRDPRNQFLDVEAEVDEEDEEAAEEDEEELGGEGFIVDQQLDDGDEISRHQDDRRHRELDRIREQAMSRDAEAEAERLRERYGRNRAVAGDAAIVPQQYLMPTVDDPQIFGVRCKPGKEREVIFDIQKRIEQRARTREPCPISAAFERSETGVMAGYIYIETRKQADIYDALDGLQNVYPRTKMVLVPPKEMPDLLRVRKTEIVQEGAWVRVKSGLYQGDLGQVDYVEENGVDIGVRLIPRIDYRRNEDRNAPLDPTGKRKRPGAGMRPPQRLFNENEAKKHDDRSVQVVTNLKARKSFIWKNDNYVDGFLVKEFKLNRLITQTQDVNPTLEEVTRFAAAGEDGSENLDLSALQAMRGMRSQASDYQPGEMVEVYEGEQRGIKGKVLSVTGDILKLSATDGMLVGQVVEVPVKGLRKLFREGDHVKVTGASRYTDEVGMVVKIKGDRVTILTDSGQQEITLFSNHLRQATDSTGLVSGSQYDLYDLVQLDAATVACVVKVDRESLRVLDQSGSVRTLLPSNISNRLDKRRNAVATDREGSEIRVDDIVKEFSGEQREGRVLHIHRNFLFAQNREQLRDGGVFVVRTSGVTTVAAKAGNRVNAGPDLSKMNPARNGAAPNGGAAPMAPPKSFGRDKMLGKTVAIKKGPYKGLNGIVKDTTDTTARIELQGKNKIVQVAKDSLNIKDPVTGATLDIRTGRPSGNRTPFASGGNATPSQSWNASGGRTPAVSAWGGGKTPSWQSGARTPAAGAWGAGGGGKTPAWQADGSRTVNPYADGSRTAYGGGTSSWNPSSRTPYGGSGWAGSGGKTPAWGADGGKTPAWGNSGGGSGSGGGGYGSYDAPTPGGFHNAATPGAPYASAPTPGAVGDHPTPGGFRGQYQTPGAAAAATPGAWAAETPGAIPDDQYTNW